MNKIIDLHTHTVHSDGHSTVEEVLQEAEDKKVSVLSITDHNSVDAYEELKKIIGTSKVDVLSGTEITTTYNNEVIEVLGYGFDVDIMKKLLDENVLNFEQEQIKEFELIKNRYLEIGIKMDINEIVFDPKKESSRIAFCNEIKKHEENNKYFLNEETLNAKTGFTRNEVFNPESLLYVNHTSLYPSLEKTINIIHSSGGLAFLAHTFAYSKNIYNSLGDIISNYKLDGLECYYTTFTKEQTNCLLDVCDKYKLFKSGGSDFHGTNKVNHNLGTGDGTMSIRIDLISDWYNVKEKKLL